MMFLRKTDTFILHLSPSSVSVLLKKKKIYLVENDINMTFK